MKTNRSYGVVRNLVLALAGAFIFTAIANAQVPSYVGKFTLPFDTRWGLATLPAGDYSFTLNDSEARPFVIMQLFRGNKNVALILSQGYSMESSSRSALTVVRSSNGNTVRELSLPEIGVVLHYAPHKPKHATAAAQREIAQMIPVTTIAGK